jgi:hypothetical protein
MSQIKSFEVDWHTKMYPSRSEHMQSATALIYTRVIAMSPLLWQQCHGDRFLAPFRAGKIFTPMM